MWIKTMLQEWMRVLEKWGDGLFCQLQWQKTPRRSSYEAFLLQRKLEERERDLRFLQFQLTKVRADNTELQMQKNSFPSLFGAVLEKTDAQLRQEARFHVQRSEDGMPWEVVTEHCCLGGCDLSVYTFPTERDALLFSGLLQAAEYRTPHNIACPACYAEYLKDYI